MLDALPIGRALAVDLGTRRIGVAVSDPLRVVVRPLTTLVCKSTANDLARLADLVRQWQPTVVVIGLPLLPSGDRGRSAKRSEEWAARLSHLVGVPVVLWDESYTTSLAHDRRRARSGGKAHPPEAAGRRGTAQSPGVDAEAAAIILEEWLSASAEIGHENDAVE